MHSLTEEGNDMLLGLGGDHGEEQRKSRTA